ncbi:MAG: thioredoxin reductase [Thermodesulfobacteriota bacterium]|nr:MAG: thioredoxin reductase [Thermodesulfobacteriota bacterium]
MTKDLIPDSNTLDPSDPYARLSQTFPTLSDEQIERVKFFGVTEKLDQGTVVFERGEKTVDFFVVLSGNIEIYEHRQEGIKVLTVHSEKQFTGEVDLFNDRKILVGGRMGEEGDVVRVNRINFRKLITAEPDIGEIVMRAFILRRVGLISHEQGSVTLIGSRDSRETIRIERFLRRNGYPVILLSDLESEECKRILNTCTVAGDDLPAVLLYNEKIVLKKPTTLEVAEHLGLFEEIDQQYPYDVAVVGAGPGGLSAALNAASEGLRTIVLETEAPGGQAGTSSKIENYLGFPTGISGQALAGRAQIQAQKFGTKIALPRAVEKITSNSNQFTLDIESGETITSRAVVIASGARYRNLGLEEEKNFENAGLYYAATAMEASLCEDEEVIIVGGGNSAGQAAVFLSKYASHVHILVRSGGLAASMSDYLIERINSSGFITLHTRTEIIELRGDNRLKQVVWKNRESGETRELDVQYVFLMIGAVPNTGWLKETEVGMDENGFVCTGSDVVNNKNWPLETRPPMMLETSVPGIFAVGDVRANSVKRVTSAVGEGGMAINSVHRYLSDLEER